MTRCPVLTCCLFPKADEIACRDHWRMVPSEIRTEVLRAFRAAPGTPNHLRAVKRAIRYLELRYNEGRTRTT